VVVYSPSSTSSCDAPDVGQRYMLHVSGGKLAEQAGPDVNFYRVGRDLPECGQPFACRLFAAPDLDGEGGAELAVQVAKQDSIRSLVLYRLEESTSGNGYELALLTVATPGDPDNGFPPGSALFAWGGSDTRKDSVQCRAVDGERWLVASTAQASDGKPGTWDVRESEFSVHGGDLKLEAKADYPGLAPDDNPPFVRPDTFCGAPIVGEG